MADPIAFRVERAPIIEAIVDIHCVLPPTFNRGAFHSAAQRMFADKYPEFRTAFVHEQKIAFVPGKEPKAEAKQTVRGYQSVSSD